MAEKKNEMKEECKLVNCLENRQVIVRHVTRTSFYTGKNSQLDGGLFEGCERRYMLPVLLSSGTYVNALTNAEKDYLEYVMDMEPNALSVHRNHDNFWDDFVITLTKDDKILHLDDPMDYIRYKVLLANSDEIARSTKYMEDHPSPLYHFVLVSEEEDKNSLLKDVELTQQAFMKLGALSNDKDSLVVLQELMEGKRISDTVRIESVIKRLGELIKNNPSQFLRHCNDELFPVKVLIRRCIAHDLIIRKGDNYYKASDGQPLCEANYDPTFNVAASYLADPKHSQLKFDLEDKLQKLS